MRYADHSPSPSALSLVGAADPPEAKSSVPRSYVSTIALAILFVSLAIVADSVGASDPVSAPAVRIVTAAR